MNVSVFSQTTFPIKTVYQGKNAVLISEPQMDSINITYLRLKVALAKEDMFKINENLLNTKLESKNLTIDYLKTENKNLKNQKMLYDNRIENLLEKHEYDLRKKNKGKVYWFLGGTILGLVSALIML
jgi:FtsZ-binding cell division protein ZapB